MYAQNVDFTGGSPVSGKVVADGQLMIGSAVAPYIRVANLTSSGSTVTITNGPGTINIEAGASVPTTFTSDSGTATPSLNNINLLGGTGIDTTASLSSVTVSFDITEVPAIPTSFVTGSGTAIPALNSVTLTNGAGITMSAVGSAVTIAINTATVGQTITGNSGGALSPTAGDWNFLTSGSTVKFVGSASTITQDFALDNLLIGTNASSLSSGTSNVGFGFAALEDITTGRENVAVGRGALANITTNSFNTAVGHNAAISLTNSETVAVGAFALQTATTGGEIAIGYRSLVSCTDGAFNVGIGTNALDELTTGDNNTCVGSNVAHNLISGNRNIAIGYFAADTYDGAESNNIVIGHSGVLGESNVMRLGTQGSGAGQILQTHIAGVVNTVSGRVVKITSPGAYPYTTLTTDYMILVDTSSARTITPLGSPVTGTMYVIKDSVGSAATNNITVTPSGKNIDGAASFTINVAYGSITIVYGGTEWHII